MKPLFLAGACALAISAPLSAHDESATRADGHGPIGVMGDHRHDAGEFMLSYRFMRMVMDGNRIGTNSVTPEMIATTVANPFAGPPTLRVVPTEMTMDMHMFGAMWAPNDRVTLMAMVNYETRDMDHITFQGMMGTNRLGTFNTKSEGFGDTRVSALIGLFEGTNSTVHAQVGFSLPTGSIDETDDVLTPMNTNPTLTLPYAMQLGSGTFDPLLGITATGVEGHWTWGAQARAILRISENDADYSLGDDFQATGWVAWSPVPEWSFSGRLQARTLGSINGRDMRIGAPVQTANPDNYGGEWLNAFIGANWAGQPETAFAGHRLAAEFGMPLMQDLNGPQMETGWMLTLGWQYAFGGRGSR